MFSYGLARFVKDAQAAGADGFIIPDLPPEEEADFVGALR
jgi:tryptophan synthase alpha chain